MLFCPPRNRHSQLEAQTAYENALLNLRRIQGRTQEASSVTGDILAFQQTEGFLEHVKSVISKRH